MQTFQAALSHIHRFVPGAAERPLLLLHGTGGDENDLLDLGAAVAPGVALLSPRGQVREGSMNRFFRRFAEGLFDIEDIKARTHALADFIAEARTAYGLGVPVAMGFSNGANIASALLMLRPESLAGAILLRAMHTFDPDVLPDLSKKPVLFLSGGFDSMMSPEQAKPLAAILEKAGAALTHRTLRAGHSLTQEDVSIAAQWWAQLPKA
jgi:phospholipase/carboxylesterase